MNTMQLNFRKLDFLIALARESIDPKVGNDWTTMSYRLRCEVKNIASRTMHDIISPRTYDDLSFDERVVFDSDMQYHLKCMYCYLIDIEPDYVPAIVPRVRT